MNVYKAINAVQRDLSSTGITKDRRNTQQGYNFRGIDDVFNALSPLLAKHGLCILPRVTEREQVERQSAKGGTLFFVTVGMEFDFIASEDGSRHTIKTFGEAMDSADKATNKAMSAAYKYAALQAFAIPTEGDNDAEHHNHEVVPRRPEHQEPRPRTDKVAGQKLANGAQLKWVKDRLALLDPDAAAKILAAHGIKALDTELTAAAFDALKTELLK